MSIDAELDTAMASIPDCFAAGYIDMQTGMLLGARGEDEDSEEALDTLAGAAANLFQGEGIQAFAEMLQAGGTPDPDAPGFGEIVVFSGNALHVFLRTPAYPDHVVCYICRDSANVGLALTKSHMTLDQVTNAI